MLRSVRPCFSVTELAVPTRFERDGEKIIPTNLIIEAVIVARIAG